MLHPYLEHKKRLKLSSKEASMMLPPNTGQRCIYAGIAAKFIGQSILHKAAYILSFNEDDLPLVTNSLFLLNSNQNLPYTYKLVPADECEWENLI